MLPWLWFAASLPSTTVATARDTHPDGGDGSSAVTRLRSAAPAWLVELLEILELRRQVLLTAVAGLSLLGVLAAFVLPQFVPPRPMVGAAVGLAAVLLGVAIALAVDSIDLTIRGPRHVRSSGGLLAAHVSDAPEPAALTALVRSVSRRHAHQGRTLVGVAAVDDVAELVTWSDALAQGLSAEGLRVLSADLHTAVDDHPGVAEVASGRMRLAEAVRFDEERMLARLGPGHDRAGALSSFPAFAARLPSDIDVLLVALPPLAEGGALGAAASLDHVYLLVHADRTPRVDLIASLDALDATSATSEVVLVSPRPPAPPEVAGTHTEEADAEPADAWAPELAPMAQEPAPTEDEPALVDDEPEQPDVEPEPELEAATDLEAEPEVEPETVTELEAATDAEPQPTEEPVDVADEPADEPVEEPGEEPGDGPDEPALAARLAQELYDTPDVGEDGDDTDDELRATVAAAAVADLHDDDDAAEEDDAEEDEDLEDLDPTVETPPVVIPAASVAPTDVAADIREAADIGDDADDADDADADDVHDGADPWVLAPAGAGLPGWSHADDADPDPAARVEADRVADAPRRDPSPFPDEPDLPEDPVRVAAALQSLAQEIWGREASDSRRR